MKQVLVIEDDIDNLGLIRLALQRSGYQVAGATTGSEGVRLACETPFTFIVLDINLPDLDGFEVLRRIKKGGESSGSPLVAVTSNAMAGDRERCLNAGCAAYFEKPIDPVTIVDQIHAAIGLKGEL